MWNQIQLQYSTIHLFYNYNPKIRFENLFQIIYLEPFRYVLRFGAWHELGSHALHSFGKSSFPILEQASYSLKDPPSSDFNQLIRAPHVWSPAMVSNIASVQLGQLHVGTTVGLDDGIFVSQEVGSQGPQISGNSSLPIITHASLSLKDPPPDVCNQLIRSPHE